MKPNVAVVVFPGSNCEQDVVYALRREGADADYAWHGDADLGGADAAVLPGGFAHGDYLRTGAIARFSPVMEAVRELADDGKPVLGICNGFQILAEAHLVPGALIKNEGLRFLCVWTEIVVEDTDTVATRACERGQRLRIPINHYEGNYRYGGFGGQAERSEAAARSAAAPRYGGLGGPAERSEAAARSAAAPRSEEPRVAFRYAGNPNGAWHDIAGVSNDAGNVVGMMPHPERASEQWLGSTDGRFVLASLIESCRVPSRA